MGVIEAAHALAHRLIFGVRGYRRCRRGIRGHCCADRAGCSRSHGATDDLGYTVEKVPPRDVGSHAQIAILLVHIWHCSEFLLFMLSKIRRTTPGTGPCRFFERRVYPMLSRFQW